jgi:hypothetical protein
MDKNTYIIEKLFVENAQLRMKILELEYQILELQQKLQNINNQKEES